MFYPDRYAPSFHPPSAINGLTTPNHHVWQTAAERNWSHRVEVHVVAGGTRVAYQVFFGVEKVGWADRGNRVNLSRRPADELVEVVGAPSGALAPALEAGGGLGPLGRVEAMCRTTAIFRGSCPVRSRARSSRETTSSDRFRFIR